MPLILTATSLGEHLRVSGVRIVGGGGVCVCVCVWAASEVMAALWQRTRRYRCAA